MENRYKISYDMKQKCITNIKFKQGDIDSSVLDVTLFDDGKTVDISGEVIEFRFQKPDNTIVFQDISAGVSIANGPAGNVQCILKSNTLARTGQVKCEIHRSKDSKILTTPSFYFMVEDTISGDGILSTNYISSIDGKLAEMTASENIRKSNEQERIALYNVISTKLSNGELKGDKGDQGIQGIQGLKGDTGAIGAVPNITIGTTTTLPTGSQATVVRKADSPDTAPVFDFGIPKGQDGTGTGNMDTKDYDPTKSGSVRLADNLKGLTVPVSELNKITPNTEQTKALLFGMNLVQIPEMPTAPKFKFTGFSLINLLGKDGNCEDTSKWSYTGLTPSLDSANKIAGANGFKLTLTTGAGVMYKAKADIPTLQNTKYYMFSFYLKNGNANSGVRIVANTSGSPASSQVTGTSWVRKCIRLTPQQVTDFISIYADVNGSVGQYIYVDCGMVNEISASDYTLSDDALMKKYPEYVDSDACLTNLYFENRRYNLVMNGNGERGVGYWLLGTNAILNYSNGYYSTSVFSIYQNIVVKPSTSYSFRVVVKAGTANPRVYIACLDENLVYISDGYDQNTTNTADTTFTGTFTTPSNAKYVRVYINATAATQATGIAYFKEWMLIEGTTPPTSYTSQDLQRFVVEGQFDAGDDVTIENKKVSGLKWYKRKVLYGKDYDWQFSYDYAGYKAIYIPQANKINPPLINDMPLFDYWICTKYDGKILKNGASGGADMFYHSNDTILNIADTDSGWLESVNPNADEIKAFMNGWKVLTGGASGYDSWYKYTGGTLSTDISLYPQNTATTLAVATTNTNSYTVADASIFKVGDLVTIYGLGSQIISSISGNVITVPSPVGTNSAGLVVLRLDNIASGDRRILAYCKNNIASGYEGYKIRYKLANPEPITDVNTHVEGEIWNLVKGDNYVLVDSGIVLGEVVNSVLISGTYYTGLDVLNDVAYSPWKYKQESINNIYKNLSNDMFKWISYNNDASDKGGYLYTAVANFDTNAIYTVDYQILKTLHAQAFGSLSLSYQQSITSTLENHSKELEQKQAKNSVLDDLIDLSMYEEGDINNTVSRAVKSATLGTTVMISSYTKFSVRKKVLPIIKLLNPVLYVRDDTGVAHPVAPDQWSVFVFLDFIYVNAYLKTGTTNATNALNNGLAIVGRFTADCRGRV